MRWPWRRSADEARQMLDIDRRHLADAQALGRAADDLNRRAAEVHDQWRETKEVNHVAEAVVDLITRRMRHP